MAEEIGWGKNSLEQNWPRDEMRQKSIVLGGCGWMDGRMDEWENGFKDYL